MEGLQRALASLADSLERPMPTLPELQAGRGGGDGNISIITPKVDSPDSQAISTYMAFHAL